MVAYILFGILGSLPRTFENWETTPPLYLRMSLMISLDPFSSCRKRSTSIISLIPSKQIESQLLGAIFDPYVRFIIWEGIRTWWKPSLEQWLECPSGGDPYPHSSTHPIPASSSYLGDTFRSASGIVLSLLPHSVAEGIRGISPIPLDQYQGFSTKSLSSTPAALALNQSVTITGDKNPACPYTWASEIHGMNCEFIWPKEYEGPGHPLIELDTDQYVGRIRRENTMERLLAMGGLRLAKIVNEILGDEGEKGLYMGY